jgi:ribonuclease R
MGHIARLPHARASFKQLVRELGTKGGARAELEEILDRLVERGDLIETRSGQYIVTSESREFTIGRVQMHRDGYGFVVPEKPVPGMSGDLFLPPDAAERAMHGDRVLARIVRFDENGRAEGEIVRILKRAHATVVGEFTIRRNGFFVKPHDDRIQQWVEIPEGMEIPESGETVNRVGVEPV